MSSEIIQIISGLSLGAIYALLVLGLVITYRMSRFLNLAHGALGMFVTYLYWQMASDWGWNRWLSVAIALGMLAPVIGVAVGRFIFRRLLDREDSAKIAGSVVLVLLLTEIVSRVWGGSPRRLPNLLPQGSLRIGDSGIGWDRIAIIAIAAAITVLATLALSRTKLGTEMRAVAENRRLAGTFGIDVGRTEAIGWALGTSLATLAGILISTLSSLDSLQLTFLVIFALAAAAVGRLVSLVGAFAGAALLGVVQVEVTRLPSGFVEKFGSISASVPFLLLVVALVVLVWLGFDVGGGESDQAAGTGREQSRPSGSLRLAAAVARRSPRSLPVRGAAVAGAVALTAAVSLVVGGLVDSSWLFLLTVAAVWTIVFASMSLLNGLGGQVSLCQASFMGVGALVAVRFQQHCAVDDVTGRSQCLPIDSAPRVWLGLVLAAVVPAVLAALLAFGAARVRGVMLAVVTLSFAFFLDQTLFPSSEYAGGEFGYSMQRPPGFRGELAFFALCAVFALGAVALVRNLARSGSGRVLRMTEQSPTAARAFGVSAPAYKVAVFSLSAAMAGVGGYLYSGLLRSFQGLAYNVLLSLVLFLVIYAVGTRRTMGPVVAAAAFVLVPKVLGYVGSLQDAGNLVFGVGALVSLGLPGGFLGALALRRERAAQRVEALRARSRAAPSAPSEARPTGASGNGRTRVPATGAGEEVRR